MAIKWSPSPKFLASSAHIAWASAATLASMCHNLPLGGIAIAVVALALVKEFVLDLFVIERDTYLGSVIDFIGYMAGLGLGLIAYYHLPTAIATASIGMTTLAIMDYLFSPESR